MREQVEAALSRIRPAIQSDGGDVELVDITEDGIVQVRMLGACGGCPMSVLTLKAGIERTVKQLVPGVTSVVQV